MRRCGSICARTLGPRGEAWHHPLGVIPPQRPITLGGDDACGAWRWGAMSGLEPAGARAGTAADDAARTRRADAKAEAERTQRYGALLLLVLAAFLVQGIASPRAWVQILLSLLLGAAVL